MPPARRSSSSQHGDEDGCSLSLCCKFEIDLRLFAIWLVVVKLSCKSNTMFYVWAAVPPEKGIVSSSSQHGDEDGCSLSLCCKFEIDLRLFAIWLVVVKLSFQSIYVILRLNCRAT